MATNLEASIRGCGPDCQYAEEIHGTFGEWFWCSRPAAPRRLIRIEYECVVPRFAHDRRIPVAPLENEHSLRAAQ